MTETPVPAADAPDVHFATSLVPHRSLSPVGFRWLIRGAIAANVVIGLPMLILGAWPVMGFMGLDVWLLWFLFKRSYLDARRSETLLLTDAELIVDRVSPNGDREQLRLDAYWLRVEWDEKDERLVLTSRGNRAVIGRFLAPSERRHVRDQLKAALAEMRAPRYRHAWDSEGA
ncbi:MAG: DUF2244 domain-containing protein [Reyranella sp.]|jgi:uncharacterized membrane protein|nr:DUF2244 domain-containing protein [Reyranella sp.]